MDYKSIEEKWQKAWDEAKIFEVEPDSRKSMLITAAFPYVNSPPHIGHARTYGTADSYARYLRMRGFNVLYPMAFHATGTPLLAFAKRIANNDKELIEELSVFHVPEAEIKKMTDPEYIANYFVREDETVMRAAGYGIDWRRKFVSVEPLFSKFVEWQFMKLKEMGYITKGKHPVGWCTTDNGAVGQHDTKHDIQPDIQQITVLKFKDSLSDIYFGCATYRPETLYGVSNIFINKDAKYVIAKIGSSRYYISKEAAETIKYQFAVEIEKEISTDELLSKKAIIPIYNREIPILPGFFVKPDIGTGVVMSVPAHAPFDYVALQRLKKSGYPMPEIEYRKVLDIEKNGGIGIGRSLTDVSSGNVVPIHPELPALAYLEILNADEDAIDDMVEFATKLQYREESHWGVMAIEEYKGMKEPEARELIKQKLKGLDLTFDMYLIANDEPVYCRDGTKVIVNVVDQWFINYGDPKWKEIAKGNLKDINIRPDKLRLSFEKVFEWIDLRAAERKQGLGTTFPFDHTSKIESLSDSTMYMSFYTFIHVLRRENVKPEQLTPAFFDYVLLGIGDSNEISKTTGIEYGAIEKCRESFVYWYSNTTRHSGPDLIPNHLTMYIFNHTAILKKENWPKQIVVSGFVDYEGEKMSKSLGNIVPLSDALQKSGSDPLRFILITGADLDTSTEFSAEGINSIHVKNEFIARQIEALQTIKSKELSHIDYWLYSKLNTKIKEATPMMDSLNLKAAYTQIYYNSINELKKYLERNGSNEIVTREFIESVVLMLAPAMPHVAEEFWSMLGRTTLIAKEKWPDADEQMINPEEELIEQIIDNTIEDVRQSIELTRKISANKDKKVTEVRLIIADQWKVKAYSALAKTKNIGSAMADPTLADIDKTILSQFLTQFAKKLNSLTDGGGLNTELLLKAFIEAGDYLEGKFGASIAIEGESASKSPRAGRALPEKPSIDITWG